MLMEPWSKMIKHAVLDPQQRAWNEAPDDRRIVIMWGPVSMRWVVEHNYFYQQVLWYTKSTAPTLSDVQIGMI